MFWSATFICCVVVAIWLHWRYKNRRLIAMSDKFPGPKTVPFFGNALMIMGKSDEFITVIKNLITDYGDTVRVWLGPDLNFVVSNPDDLKILLSNPNTSVKGPQYKYMADVLGGGILSGSGPTWRKHRKIAAPNFGRRAIEGYTEVFNREMDVLLEWLKQLPMDETHDIYYYIVRGTTYTVLQTVMGLTREQSLNIPNLDTIITDSPRLYDIVFDRMTKWYLQIDPIFWANPRSQELKAFEQNFLDLSKTILKYRIEYLNSLCEQEKLLKLLEPEDDSATDTKLSVVDRLILSQELNNDELQRETFTVFTGSQEASARVASALLLMMAFHPECQEKLYAEINAVMGDTDRDVTDEDLKQMLYLDMVIREVMRMFPIGAILQRTIEEDIAISTGVLPARGSLIVPVYFLQRDPRFWRDPDTFDPERFTPENCRKRPPNCYMPFSLGPMDCLGRYYATKIIKTISVRLLREFEVSSSQTYKDLKMIISISAVSLDGYHMKINPRKYK